MVCRGGGVCVGDVYVGVVCVGGREGMEVYGKSCLCWRQG